MHGECHESCFLRLFVLHFYGGCAVLCAAHEAQTLAVTIVKFGLLPVRRCELHILFVVYRPQYLFWRKAYTAIRKATQNNIIFGCDNQFGGVGNRKIFALLHELT
jgi:hypothetical protein